MQSKLLFMQSKLLFMALLAFPVTCFAQDGVNLGTDFAPPQTGLQSASVGLSGLNIAFSPGSSFGLRVINTDENPWTYQLVVVTDQGTFMSAAQSLANGEEAIFSAALGGVSGFITSTYLVVSGNVPLTGGDRTSEYDVDCTSITANTLSFSASDLAAFSLLASTHPATVTVNNGETPAGVSICAPE